MRNENDPRRLATYNIHTSQFLWLAKQAGGASGTVRRLVGEAMLAAGDVPPIAPDGPVLTERQGKLLAALAQGETCHARRCQKRRDIQLSTTSWRQLIHWFAWA